MESKSADKYVDEYVMGRTSEEYQRLRRQAQMWESMTRRLFQKLGLEEGMSCLDLGCGPGEVMRLMGEFVGPSGRVVGLDVDGKLGREALGVLQATGKSQFEFVEDCIETLSSVSGRPFDLTYARLTLLHVRDGIGMLRNMFELTKPGGWIAVQEFDFRTTDIYPKLPAFAEFENTFFGVYEKSGRETRLGRKLPAYFAEAGIGEPDGTDVEGSLLSLHESGPMLTAVYRSILPLALKLSITTEATSQQFFEQMSSLPDPGSHFVLWPLRISVWKRKPE
jgi:ubiquinone/menaquinone biosynthesis C-methylase UbiE